MKKSGVTPPGPLLITGCVRPGAIVDISATEASASPMLIIIIYCSRTLRYERTQISNQISETEPRDKNGTSHLRVVFEKTGCEMGEPEGSAARDLLPFTSRCVEFGHSLGALGDGVLGELAGEDEADGRLDLARPQGLRLGEAADVRGLVADALEDGRR